jgi:hypothetical protein
MTRGPELDILCASNRLSTIAASEVHPMVTGTSAFITEAYRTADDKEVWSLTLCGPVIFFTKFVTHH